LKEREGGETEVVILGRAIAGLTYRCSAKPKQKRKRGKKFGKRGDLIVNFEVRPLQGKRAVKFVETGGKEKTSSDC